MSTIFKEIEFTFEGDIRGGTPASYWEPGEGPCVEDIRFSFCFPNPKGGPHIEIPVPDEIAKLLFDDEDYTEAEQFILEDA